MPVPEHTIGPCRLVHGDMLAVLPTLEAGSIDACVCDPPYGLEFMGKEWDKLGATQAWHYAWAVEVLRVLKPGGYLIAMGGSRTHHRLMCAIEDAGFEIRDTITYLHETETPEAQFFQSLTPAQQQAYLELHYPGRERLWCYGSGFPKSASIGKNIDKMAGVKREIIGAKKPAVEFIIVSRRPLGGTLAQNVLKHGTGGLNIGECRIDGENWGSRPKYRLTSKGIKGGAFGNPNAPKQERLPGATECDAGRWPANLVTDGSPEALA